MPLDIVFISYDEVSADKHFKLLQEDFPYAKRVHGIKGIPEAHREAARVAKTSNFYTVDADTIVDRAFHFSYAPEKWDKDFIHLWYARNSVNDLEYGWGGIKLWPRKLLRSSNKSDTDFTTSVLGLGQLKIHTEVASTSWFNSSPLETFRSAFREAAKLTKKSIDVPDDKETAERLAVWCSKGEDRPYGYYSVHGANCGYTFIYNGGDISKINNFDWLREKYEISIS